MYKQPMIVDGWGKADKWRSTAAEKLRCRPKTSV